MLEKNLVVKPLRVIWSEVSFHLIVNNFSVKVFQCLHLSVYS